MSFMTEQEQKWIENLINGVKDSVEQTVNSIKEIFLLRINNVEIQNKSNEEDIKEIKSKQDSIANDVTRVKTRFDGHISNHKNNDTNKRGTVAIIVSIVAVIVAVLIVIFGG